MGQNQAGLARHLAQSIIALSESRRDVIDRELGLHCAHWVPFYVRLECDQGQGRWKWVLGLGRQGAGGGIIPEKMVNRLLSLGYNFEPGVAFSRCLKEEEDIVMMIDVPRSVRMQFPNL